MHMYMYVLQYTYTCTCIIHVQQLAAAYQIEVLACLTEEEALHPILMRLLHNVVQRSIATPGKVYVHV